MGMSDEKILLVLKKYEDKLDAVFSKGDKWSKNPQLVHAKNMIPKMRGFMEEGRREKNFRWLGFLQGVLYCHGIYTIEEMANHNRPTKAEFVAQNPGHSLDRFRACPGCGDIDGCHLWQDYRDAPVT